MSVISGHFLCASLQKVTANVRHSPALYATTFHVFCGRFFAVYLQIGESNARKTERNCVAFFHVLRELEGEQRGSRGGFEGDFYFFKSCRKAWRTRTSAFLKFLTIFRQRGFLPPFDEKWSGISFFFFSERQALREQIDQKTVHKMS